MHITGVVRPEVGGARIARTSIAVLFFVFLTACGGGGGSGGGGTPDAAPPTPGSLDVSFSTDGIVTTTIDASSSAAALGFQTDGKIVVAGKSVTILGVESFALARYNPDGTLDTSFGTGGIVTTAIDANSSAAALGIQTTGEIVVAGKSATILGVESFALARYTSTGALDATFGPGGTVTTAIPTSSSSSAAALGIQTTGEIVVAGTATILGADNFALARYTSTGAPDTTFDTDGIVTTTIGLSSNAFALGLQTDGKIVVAGNATNFGADFFLALARYTSTGALDTTFGTSGIVTTAIGAIAGASALALQSDGKIVVAGFSDGSIALARYNP